MLRAINWQVGGLLSIASGATQVIATGMLAPRYHFVRGLWLAWVCDSALNNLDEEDYSWLYVYAHTKAKVAAADIEKGEPVIAGSASAACRFPLKLQQLYIPINYTARDGKGVFLHALLNNTTTGNFGITGTYIWDVVALDSVLAAVGAVSGVNGKSGLSAAAGGA